MPQHGRHSVALGSRAVPIHVRAEPGDYAEACLLPGDPLRAKYIAETFLDDPVQRNSERGMLGYTGTFRGQAGVGAVERDGLPVRRDRDRGARSSSASSGSLRVGTCGGLQPDLSIGDLIVAHVGRPGRPDRDAPDRRRAARADRRLGARPRRRPRGEGARQEGARRPDRLERRLLQPGRGPVPALVGPRHPRRRDGGGDALHARRAARRSRPAAS